MAKKESTQAGSSEMASLDQWMQQYGITVSRDQQFNEIANDPDRLGVALANSTMNRLLKRKNLTKGSAPTQ